MGDFLPTNMNTLSVIGTSLSIFGIMAATCILNPVAYAPKPPATELVKKTIKDTVKSVTGDTDNPLPEEMELIRTKEDAILENAEIVGYKMVIQIAERAGAQDTIPVLEQNMKEEQSMADWIMANTPLMLDQLWPKIQAAATSSDR
jgi:hypothetical protein